MADVAQLVRALVCGTKCRRFESGHPPHYKTSHLGRFSLIYCLFYGIMHAFSGRHFVVFFIPPPRAGVFFTKRIKHEQIIKQYTKPYAQKENRIEYLRGLSDWGKYGDGWANRTNRY